jgi:Na+/proline symporter
VGYTILGGLSAVVGTDYIQSLLILVGLVILGVAAYFGIGIKPIYTILATERPGLLNLFMPASVMFLFNNLLFGMGEIFHSNVWWSRALAFRKGMGFRAYLVAGLAWIPVPIVAGSLALAAPALGINVPALDMVGPLVAAKLLGGPGAILILIVVFASLASSLDSLLAATSDLLVQDIYRSLLNPKASDQKLRQASRLVVILLGMISIVLCWCKLTTLAEMIQFTGPFVASTIWPIATGLYWQDTNRHAATIAIILGTLAGLVSYFAIGFYTGALIGAVVSMVCVLMGSWLRPEVFYWQEFSALQRPTADARDSCT